MACEDVMHRCPTCDENCSPTVPTDTIEQRRQERASDTALNALKGARMASRVARGEFLPPRVSREPSRPTRVTLDTLPLPFASRPALRLQHPTPEVEVIPEPGDEVVLLSDQPVLPFAGRA